MEYPHIPSKDPARAPAEDTTRAGDTTRAEDTTRAGDTASTSYAKDLGDGAAKDPAGTSPADFSPRRSPLHDAAATYGTDEPAQHAEQTDSDLNSERSNPGLAEPSRPMVIPGAPAGAGPGAVPVVLGSFAGDSDLGQADSELGRAGQDADRERDPSDDSAEDVVDVLVADHREVQRMFAELEGGAIGRDRRRDLVDVVIAELSRHSALEEQYLYPAAREHLPDGDKLADHETEEHAEAERIMKRLMPLDPEDPEFDQLTSELIESIRHHLQEEERGLFPKLRRSVDRTELVKIGRTVQSARRMAPTRPHPAAPHQPPMNKVIGPASAIFDKTADALRHRPTEADDLDNR